MRRGKFMKKVLLIIVLILALSGCSSKQKKELESAISKSNALSNYAIDVVIEYDGRINTTRLEVDGDHFTYTQGNYTEHYYMIENEMYHLSDISGFPTLTISGTSERLYNDVYVIGNGEEIAGKVSKEDGLYLLDSPEEWEDFEEWPGKCL